MPPRAAPRRLQPPTRAQFAAAALALGVESFTMQQLARELELAPQALYRWVADRDAVLDLVADEVLARVETAEPPHDPAAWRPWLTELAHALRRELAQVPGVASRALTHQQATGPFVALHQAIVATFAQAGLGRADAVRAAEIFGTAVLGWIAREQSVHAQRSEGRRLAEEIAEARRRAGLPTAPPAAAAATGARGTAGKRFDAFVTVVLDGLAATTALSAA